MTNIDEVIDELRPTLKSIEQDRQAYLKKRNNFIWFVIVPGVLVAGFPAIAFFPAGLFAILGWLVVSGIVYHFTVGSQARSYVSSYKSTVPGKLVKLVGENLQYDQNRGIEQHLFEASELFTTSPDRYNTEDLIHGTHGKTSLILGEIDAEEKKTERDSDGKTKTRYVTIFDGLFLVADFHKHFHGKTFVFPDVAEKAFGEIGRALQKLSGRRGTQLIQMEDTEFEKAFAVHSTDQVEARYILSPSMMRRILDLRQRFGKDVRIAFKESSVWIAVPHSSPYLEPGTGVAATDRVQIENMLTEIVSFLDIIEEMDLNTRIWTKH